MREAQKLTESPEWQQRMKEITKDEAFKASLKQTEEMLKDPNKLAQAEAKFEHMQKVGNEQLKQGAASGMQGVMESLSDPDVMRQMTEMVSNPAFKDQLAAMSKDPQFKKYMEAMKDMMNDPEQRQKLEAMASSLKASL